MRISGRTIWFVIVSALLVLGGIFFYERARFFDGKLHVVFCDVGQGDAIYLRTPKGNDILIDGGPNDRVVSCLSRHMPFWDRTLELVFLTHPHLDHYAGFMSVLQRYKVSSFNTEDLRAETAGFYELEKIIKAKRVRTRTIAAGDTFRTTDGVRVGVLGPTKDYLFRTSKGGVIGESGEFASLILRVSFGEFDALLSGDSQKESLQEAVAETAKTFDVLHVPHHGSRSGLSADIIGNLNPAIAVISVGKNNRYGHPSGEVIRILGDQGIRVLRTDLHGEIEIVSDGKTFGVRPAKRG